MSQNSNTFAQVWKNTKKKSLTLPNGFHFGIRNPMNAPNSSN
jgi:hypothetical protein